ncbi:unnamed protein product [Lactuca virosa]|uniref:Uncharacterized protein n=1 Tax=Lactuca virosa TaxID=75947 RepID=A0AAU9MRR9_9ASTR|nr:unnamed protein product [Lactuca virosa]
MDKTNLLVGGHHWSSRWTSVKMEEDGMTCGFLFQRLRKKRSVKAMRRGVYGKVQIEASLRVLRKVGVRLPHNTTMLSDLLSFQDLLLRVLDNVLENQVA